MAQSISDTEKSKSTWQWYKNNPEVINEVTFCIIAQIPTREAIERLNEKGYPMSSRTFDRMKKRILKNWNHRYENMLETDFIPYNLASMESLKFVDYELWKIIRTSNDNWQKMRAIEIFRKSREDRFEIMIIPSAANKFAKEFDEEEKKRIRDSQNQKNPPNS